MCERLPSGLCKTVLAACAVAVLQTAGGGRASAEEDAAVMARLKGLWESENSAVLNGRVEMRFSRSYPIRSKADARILRADADAALSAIQSTRLEAVRDQIGKVFGLKFGKVFAQSLEFEGGKVSIKREGEKTAFDGETEAHYHKDNRQAEVRLGHSKVYMESLSDLYFLPSSDMLARKGDEAPRIVGRQKNDVEVRLGAWSIVAAPATGYINRAVYSTANKSGTSHYHIGAVDSRARRTVARIHIVSEYLNGMLTSVSVYEAVAVAFNLELDKATFEVGVPKDTNVYDMRGGGDGGGRHLLVQADTNNVVEYTDSVSDAAGNRAVKVGGLRLKHVAAVLFGLSLFVIVAVLVRRRRAVQLR